ncbi:hypothetical protein NQ314_004113 [Rhamnusium bicolor]|uniref:Ribosomal protein S14 n=1 Tax=Rhamnusium bicolor TaxID=1586634 RepID=A0AAV8ZL13_9CUCU|nr:hypothetical protein NQ314_004113 [Rhamnusium bicolor]
MLRNTLKLIQNSNQVKKSPYSSGGYIAREWRKMGFAYCCLCRKKAYHYTGIERVTKRI